MSWITETEILNNRSTLNGTLLPLSNSLMLQVLGNPRGNYSDNCQPVTNPAIRRLIVTENVGPFNVTGLKPAVDALRAIFADIRQQFPAIYNALGTAGMLCSRYVRGSRSSISNHSWGCAIDLTLEGRLDARGDGKAQKGLKAIYPIFNQHEFFWGAAFPTEDAMHFEVSKQLLMRWRQDGTLTGGGPIDHLVDAIDFGDRGPDVEWLQKRINILTGSDLEEDGTFGAATRAALIQFQNAHGLRPDGVAGAETRRALENAEIA